MISIIIVGRNEGWRLTKCLVSIGQIINSYSHIEFEIIYVDSKSTDDSIERAKAFEGIKIYEIIGATNSAIARNIGAKESKGEILFLVDADMEIEPEFLSHALDKRGNLKFDYLTGHLDDFFYTTEDKFLESEPRTYKLNLPIKNEELHQNGGLCLIKKKVWSSIGGMRNKFRRSQDLDLTIRLKRKGIKIIRIPHLAAKHHTVDYRNEKRMWNILWSGDLLYPGLIFRNHIFTMSVIKRVIRSEYTAILLLIFLFCMFSNNEIFMLIGICYLFMLLLRVGIHGRKAKINGNRRMLYFFERVLFQLSADISFWIGFLLFFPSNKILSYKKIHLN